jgi:Rps23 Pro-64 3,4-dihydroxylase Tpa1-like proline 4-hydroxylase
MFAFKIDDVIGPDAYDPRFPMHFRTRPGKTEWWRGDSRSFPLLDLDKGHPRLVVKRRALSAELCQTLIGCWRRHTDKLDNQTVDFWKERVLQHTDIPLREERSIHRILQQARLFTQIAVMEKFTPGRPIYSDSAQIVRWSAGAELPPHADNIEPDGRPNATPHRSHSSVLYLNDGFVGGEIYFPGLQVRVRPEPGLLIAFTAGTEHVHGVLPILSGERFTLAGWFTQDPAMADAMHDVIV